MGVTCTGKADRLRKGRNEGNGAIEKENVGPAEMQKKKKWQSLTIDVETVLIQGVGAQLGDTMGQLVQLPV